jgi:hypothetical protein
MTTMETLRESIEQGRPIDFKKTAALQVLDHVIRDEQYADEANRRQTDADKQITGFAV